ncbi:MAG: phosphoglycerate kinase [Candidatus Paceibacterota bacterium]|jgi:phosphoglycerate kinase|nr:phosphoglycerate kinase [Candidatus Paceibacterota bacterium]
MKLPNITKLKNLKGKRVLLRVDFNVPIKDGAVVDDFRIQKVVPTIQFLKKSGAKTIILSHIGREKTDSLFPISSKLGEKIPHVFVEDFGSEEGKTALVSLKNGEVALIQNLRKWDGEKASDKKYAKTLAQFGDVYVNEAFAVSHRKDASVFLLPKLLPSYFGPLFCEEVENLSLAFKKHKPFLCILGGAKFETKMPLVKKYLVSADTVFVGGALANTFYKMKGLEIGASLADGSTPAMKALLKNKKMILPLDVVVDGPTGKIVRSPDQIEMTEKIVDDGPETIKMLETEIKKAKFVLWNGPLGYYEGGFDGATLAVAAALVKSGVQAVVGGGDTVAAIEKNKTKSKNIFVSTAGGAMLDFLSKGTLPAIDVVMKKK